MDFIERLFHLSPDGGTGATEFSYVLLLVLVLACVYQVRARKRHGHLSSGRRYSRQ
jgi:hypothetical protein